ncbi:MAG: hypothetical protein MJ192_11090 [Clostridia bacterium]|nr:hypothetical protein [Clostridia bacterium]
MNEFNESSLKPGQWITQYNSGLWMVVGIAPRYAEEAYTTKEGVHYNKGDHDGDFVLMKKGFTSKMKFRVDSDICSAGWAKPVSAETEAWIRQYFEEHPKDLAKFEAYEFKEKPLYSSFWLHLTEEEEQQMTEFLASLPPKFSSVYFNTAITARSLDHTIQKPPATHILWLQSSCIELDENNEKLYHSPELKRMGE